MSDRRPRNIVFIMADQLGAKQVGCYGSGVDSTPTIDALARSGRRFDRCYATCPVCAPNRGSILTGRSPVVHGVVGNDDTLPGDTPTWAHVLRAAGYRTGGFGKFHQVPMRMDVRAHPVDMAHLGFDESWCTEDPKWPWAEWIERQHPEALDRALALTWTFWDRPYSHLRPRAERAVAEILAPLQAESAHPLMYRSPVPPELHDTAVITDHGLDFMHRHLDEHPDEPFVCHLSYVDPHDPYDPPEAYAALFDPADMPPAVPQEWDPGERPTLHEAAGFRGFRDCDDRAGVIAEMRARYHGSLKLIDDQIARVVRFLDQRGLRDDTAIVFTSDHGDELGDHGLLTKGVKPYDGSIRCPLVVAGPGVAPGVDERLTCALDILPGLCDLAGVAEDQRPPTEGRSFLADDPGHEAVSVSYRNMHSLITADAWRLTVFDGEDGGQLVDLRGDPNEQCNHYLDPEYAERREAMLRAQIRFAHRPHTVPQYRALPRHAGRRWFQGVSDAAHWPDLPLTPPDVLRPE